MQFLRKLPELWTVDDIKFFVNEEVVCLVKCRMFFISGDLADRRDCGRGKTTVLKTILSNFSDRKLLLAQQANNVTRKIAVDQPRIFRHTGRCSTP